MHRLVKQIPFMGNWEGETNSGGVYVAETFLIIVINLRSTTLRSGSLFTSTSEKLLLFPLCLSFAFSCIPIGIKLWISYFPRLE